MKNTRQVQNARKYLIESIDFTGYNNRLNSIRDLYIQCMDEYSFSYNIQKYGAGIELIKQRLLGLPSCLHISFTYVDIKDRMVEFGYKNPSLHDDKYRTLLASIIYEARVI